jgi:prolycopene isomerase
MTPTGDFLGYMAIAGRIRMNLVSGSVATADEPGCIAIPQQFEKVVLANGGEVWRNTHVKEVLIENGRAVGVRIKADDNDYEGDREIRADQIICTIPPKYIFSVLPKENFPADYVKLLTEKFWGAGLLTGWYGMTKPQFPDVGIDEGSFVFMPGITDPEEGFIGVVDMVMCDFTAWGNGTAKRGPAGKREYLFSTALTDEEMRNPDRVNRVIELCEDWAKRTFPDWEESKEFSIWTPGPEAYGLWRPVGTDRPDVKSPHVEGLYFAGDQYGKRLWGGGVDGAALSAVMCVDTITNSNFEEEIMPDYHRGIPELQDS